AGLIAVLRDLRPHPVDAVLHLLQLIVDPALGVTELMEQLAVLVADPAGGSNGGRGRAARSTRAGLRPHHPGREHRERHGDDETAQRHESAGLLDARLWRVKLTGACARAYGETEWSPARGEGRRAT